MLIFASLIITQIKRTHSKAWLQSTVDGTGWLKPVICTVESIKTPLQPVESVAWALWVSWKRIELLETEVDSSQDLSFISAVSDQPKLPTSLRAVEQAEDEPLNLVREAPHQFPPEEPVWNSSAMTSKNSYTLLFWCISFYVGVGVRQWEEALVGYIQPVDVRHRGHGLTIPCHD